MTVPCAVYSAFKNKVTVQLHLWLLCAGRWPSNRPTERGLGWRCPIAEALDCLRRISGRVLTCYPLWHCDCEPLLQARVLQIEPISVVA